MKYIGLTRPSHPLGNSIQRYKSWTLQATFRASLEAIEMAEDSGFARGQSVGHWIMTDSGAIYNDLHRDIGR